MRANDALDGLREGFQACQIVAFVDLAADMVLAKSAEKDMVQEQWDRLCAMARDVLYGHEAAKALVCLGHETSDKLLHAAIMQENECNIFLRNPMAPGYALCAVASADLPLSGFYEKARPTLAALVRDD